MQKILLLLSGLSLGLINAQQQKFNENLKKELDEIMKVDQGYRMLFDSEITPEKKSQILKDLNIDSDEFERKGWDLVAEHDTLNIKRIESIISQYGYPGKTLVGEPTNHAAWYVIQHSTKIAKYFPLIKEAGEKKEIPFTWVAMMEDRYLMNDNREQIYGTQGKGEMTKDKDGKQVFVNFVWPIKDPENVNKRRKEAGFDSTIEEIAKRMFGKDFIYKPYTLKQVLELKNKNK
ncbi:hypothetical protein C1637_24500 [Chryseobacterium lactis]|uniref:GLPGLI family protein n=1 Tax=Chryseobacterium lactis TaxID=1241981 RepID=A0A3G6RQ24_CHRLC|nr:DUF6624 domain-containing protein [Chryseobacterium lactis]AZA81994.1 hypothetical protein EG342_08770 [Chryseobacterium lactis]AZB06992.1 hypothetical protein EG341_24885 [Chryseobacterium lactis]PNW11061.1 hypothetical protein C1637_24500 [Chryseobacterium lactis]